MDTTTATRTPAQLAEARTRRLALLEKIATSPAYAARRNVAAIQDAAARAQVAEARAAHLS